MIHTVLTALLDTLFPPQSEVLAIRHVPPEQFLKLAERHHYNDVTVLTNYREPLVRAAIHAHKFYGNRHATALICALLAPALAALPPHSFLVPIPLGRKRSRARGYNQVTTLLHTATHAHQVLEDLLVRTRETTEQSHLARTERLTNLKGAFAYNTKYLPNQFKDAHLVIVDDVVTTGTTLQEAATTLRRALPASAKVTCLAIAH